MKKSKLLVTSLFILTMTSCSNLGFNPQNSTNPSISNATSENKDDTSSDNTSSSNDTSSISESEASSEDVLNSSEESSSLPKVVVYDDTE